MWHKKHFLSFFKGFQLPKIISGLRVHLYVKLGQPLTDEINGTGIYVSPGQWLR